VARGTVVGEPVVSQANTREYEEGYDRAGLGTSETAKERGRFIYDPVQKKLVRAEDYRPPDRALDAPIMVDRFYENTKATDGTDIGSRAKHRAYMKANGLASADDFSPGWYAARRSEQKREADRTRHATIDRAFHDIDAGRLKPNRRPRDE
jgi:hypothetical protein